MNVLENINNYYSDKIKVHGATPKGVDWNGEEGQLVRFEQLSKIINSNSFSVNDIGCGYGKYVDYLKKNYKNFIYTGYDLSQEMIKNAQKIYPNNDFKKIIRLDELQISDYSIASGIFSVKMEHSEPEWLAYVLDTLDTMNKTATKGFSFNMLTKYSDREYMKKDLYYADPLYIFDYCKCNFSKQVALLHDYGLYEFTILVRKDM